MPFKSTALTMTLVLAFLTGMYLMLAWTSSINKRAEESGIAGTDGLLLPEIGCPVILTDQTRFRGAHRCFELGSVRDLDLRGSGISPEETGPSGTRQKTGRKVASSFERGAVGSVGVRPGFRLIAYSEPDFRGEVVMDRSGPSDRSFSDGSEDPVSMSCGRKMEDVMAGRWGGETDTTGGRKRNRMPVPRSLRVNLSGTR